MTDKDQVIAQLENQIKDGEIRDPNVLVNLCNEIFQRYDEASSQGVSSLLQRKIQLLKGKFDDAHRKLLEKITS